MPIPWIRTAVATAAITLVATGCDPGGTPATENQPTVSTPATRRSTPAATPSPAVSPTAVGLENLPVRAIVQKTREASLATTSVRVRGSLEADGELIGFDILTAAGGGEGTFTVAGGPYTLRAIGKTVYMRLSESAIRAQAKAEKSSRAETAQILKLLKNKWIKLSKVDKDTQEMLNLIAPGGVVRMLLAEDNTGTGIVPRKVAARTVDGVRCVGITGSGATMWIDTTTGRLIQVTDGKNRFSFSAYGRTPAPKAPAKSQVLDGKAMGL